MDTSVGQTLARGQSRPSSDAIYYQEAERFVVCSSCASSAWQEECDEVICCVLGDAAAGSGVNSLE